MNTEKTNTQYIHNVKFYETDKMGITHHSNYIRWMEEARIHYLMMTGCDYRELEELGLSSPVVSVNCKYIKPTQFSEDVAIDVSVKAFNGVRLVLEYIMTCRGEEVCRGESKHCFVTGGMELVNLKHAAPEYYRKMIEVNNK